MNNNEMSVSDALKEIRKLADTSPDGIIAIKGHVIADRIEAAWKREKAECEAMALSVGGMVEASRHKQVGNAAAMREAVVTMNNLFEKGVICTSYANSAEEMEQIEELYRKTKAALASPPRNCDVGTAVEQLARYNNFTDRYNPCSYRGYARCAEDCPVRKKLIQEEHGSLLCQLEWGQMPYEEDASFTKTGENVNSGSAVDMEVNKPENRRAQ